MNYKYFLLIIFTYSFSFGQMSVTDLQGNPLQDGGLYTYSTNDFEPAKLKYVIGNTSATEDINVLIEVVSFSNTDGSNCQLCVQPLCFFSINQGQSYPNNPITLSPGADNGPNDYFSNTNPGDGANYPIEYVLRFYTVDESGVEVGNDLTVTYQYSPNVNTTEFNLEDLGITLHSTVVTESLNFDTSKEVSFKVYDINAREIDSSDANIGQHQYNLSDLSSGHYIVVFNDKAGRKTQVRIQKK
jgi:hypothetical protein